MLKRSPSRQKRVTSFLCLVTAITHLQGFEVELQDVISEGSCFQESENTTSVSFRLEPPDATVFYVKCYSLSPASNKKTWVYAYLFQKAPSRKPLVYRVTNQYSHRWSAEDGTFSLVVKNPETPWYMCEFEGAGKRRPGRSTRYPRNTWHLESVLGGSGCYHRGESNVQLVWKTIPGNANIFHAKCYRTDQPASPIYEHLFTYKFDNEYLRETYVASKEGLWFKWSEALGELTITVPNPSARPNKTWYYCDFSGSGRHIRRRAYIQLRSHGNSDWPGIEQETALLTETWEEWTSSSPSADNDWLGGNTIMPKSYSRLFVTLLAVLVGVDKLVSPTRIPG